MSSVTEGKGGKPTWSLSFGFYPGILFGMRTYEEEKQTAQTHPTCLLYTSPSPRDRQKSRMPSSA